LAKYIIALRSPAPKPALLKDQGVHLTQLEVARQTAIDKLGGIEHLPPVEFLELQSVRTRAEMAFLESLRLNTVEPGALFGLGWLNLRKKEFTPAASRFTALIDSAHSLIPADRKKYLGDSYENRAYALWYVSHDADKAFDDLKKSKAEAITDGVLDAWKAKLESDADFGALCVAEPSLKQALLA